MEKQSNGVQSLEVGLSVLNVLVEAGAALMLKEVAAAADMHPAKAHRYLVSLVKCGYAKQQTDGRYGLGNAALTMGLAATRRSDGLQIAQPCLQQLHQEVGEYLQVARWTPLGPLVVQFLDNEFGIPISAKVGAIMPILRSARVAAWVKSPEAKAGVPQHPSPLGTITSILLAFRTETTSLPVLA